MTTRLVAVIAALSWIVPTSASLPPAEMTPSPSSQPSAAIPPVAIPPAASPQSTSPPPPPPPTASPPETRDAIEEQKGGTLSPPYSVAIYNDEISPITYMDCPPAPLGGPVVLRCYAFDSQRTEWVEYNYNTSRWEELRFSYYWTKKTVFHESLVSEDLTFHRYPLMNDLKSYGCRGKASNGSTTLVSCKVKLYRLPTYPVCKMELVPATSDLPASLDIQCTMINVYPMMKTALFIGLNRSDSMYYTGNMWCEDVSGSDNTLRGGEYAMSNVTCTRTVNVTTPGKYFARATIRPRTAELSHYSQLEKVVHLKPMTVYRNDRLQLYTDMRSLNVRSECEIRVESYIAKMGHQMYRRKKCQKRRQKCRERRKRWLTLLRDCRNRSRAHAEKDPLKLMSELIAAITTKTSSSHDGRTRIPRSASRSRGSMMDLPLYNATDLFDDNATDLPVYDDDYASYDHANDTEHDGARDIGQTSQAEALYMMRTIIDRTVAPNTGMITMVDDQYLLAAEDIAVWCNARPVDEDGPSPPPQYSRRVESNYTSLYRYSVNCIAIKTSAGVRMLTVMLMTVGAAVPLSLLIGAGLTLVIIGVGNRLMTGPMKRQWKQSRVESEPMMSSSYAAADNK